MIAKEDYGISEDIVTILYQDKKGEIFLNKFYQCEYLPVLTLDKIKEDGKKYEDLVLITVLAENPLNGRAMRYDVLHDTWDLLGTLKGYA